MAVEQPGVLVVDDDPALRGLLTDALVDEGYETRAVEGGSAALQLLRHWTPGLIVLDLRLRDMDGATLLGGLQGSDFSRIPVVVLTASTLNDLAADELGAPVLTKPFELDELLRMVSGLVNRTPASPPCVVASEA